MIDFALYVVAVLGGAAVGVFYFNRSAKFAAVCKKLGLAK